MIPVFIGKQARESSRQDWWDTRAEILRAFTTQSGRKVSNRVKLVTICRRLVLVTLVFILQQGEWSPVLASIQRTGDGTRWAANTESGVPIWIGLDSLICDYSSRHHIVLYLEPRNFTPERLRTVFLHLSNKYLQPEWLLIDAWTDRSYAEEWVHYYEHFYSIPPDSRAAITLSEVAESELDKRTMGYRAHYSRSPSGEVANYIPRPASREIATIVPESAPSFLFSGDAKSELVIAARRGFDDQVKRMLENGVYINARNKHGDTPLLAATKAGQNRIVRTLLEHGADVNLADACGWTPLMCAIVQGLDDMTTELLHNRPDVNARSESGDTVLTRAALRSPPVIIEELLRRGADVNAADRYARTALMIAKEHRRAEVISLLTKATAKR